MPPPKELPAQVTASHRGWDARVVYAPYWTATWKLTSPSGEIHFAKVACDDLYPSLAAERDRMVWALPHLPVPEVVDYGSGPDVEWLVTRGLLGVDATDPELKSDPRTLIPILARGLRAFHDAPVTDCPFDFRLDAALEHCRRRVDGEVGVGRAQGDDFHDEFAHLSPQDVLGVLRDTRPTSEDLVVCHGDYCFPNVLVQDGRAVGYVDLGELGVADRWWDLAVGTWTCDWNVGPGWQDLFLDAYGIERDEERITYYRLMYELAS